MNNRTFGAFFNKSNNSYFQPTPYLMNTQQKCSFIFSLNNKRIYYTDLIYRDSYEKPDFIINYDGKNACFIGIEYKNNEYNGTTESMGFSEGAGAGPTITDYDYDITKNIFVLSGAKQFIVSNLEIFDVKFWKIIMINNIINNEKLF